MQIINNLRYGKMVPVFGTGTIFYGGTNIYNHDESYKSGPEPIQLLDPHIGSMWNYGKSSQSSSASWSRTNLLSNSVYQYNFLYTGGCGSELDRFDYSNAKFVTVVSQNTIGLSNSLSSLLNSSQLSSLQSAISNTETTTGTYDDNVMNAILDWWMSNMPNYMWWSSDAYYTIMNRKQRNDGTKCDIGVTPTQSGSNYNLDDTTTNNIGYNTTGVWVNGTGPCNLCCWQSLAIIFYNVYYLKHL